MKGKINFVYKLSCDWQSLRLFSFEPFLFYLLFDFLRNVLVKLFITALGFPPGDLCMPSALSY